MTNNQTPTPDREYKSLEDLVMILSVIAGGSIVLLITVLVGA